MNRYRLTNCDCPNPSTVDADMRNHDDAISWGVGLLNSMTGPTELTATKFPTGKLVVRILNAEKMFAKIENV